VAVGGAGLAAVLPQLRVLGTAPGTLCAPVIAWCVLGLGLLALRFPPRMHSRDPAVGTDNAMFVRVSRAVWWIWAAAGAFQVWNSVLAVGLDTLAPAVCAAILITVRSADDEARIWTRVAMALAFACIYSNAEGSVLGMTAVVLLLSSSNRPPRVLVASVLAGFAALKLDGGLAAGQLAVAGLVCASVLLLLLWRRRAWSAVPPLVLFTVHAAWSLGLVRGPAGGLEWGVTLLAVGFLMLVAGVFLSSRISLPEVDAEPNPMAAPTTSAAAVAR